MRHFAEFAPYDLSACYLLIATNAVRSLWYCYY